MDGESTEFCAGCEPLSTTTIGCESGVAVAHDVIECDE